MFDFIVVNFMWNANLCDSLLPVLFNFASKLIPSDFRFTFRSQKRVYRSFLDSLRVRVLGGAGGMGQPKYGGVGGKGGDVIVEARNDCSLLNILRQYPSKMVKAENGNHSGQKCIIGSPGKNTVIAVPVGVNVITEDRYILGELNTEGTSLVVAKGGPGGCKETGFSGLQGENRIIRLDLKLIADIGLIGFPNAGKSTLLAAVTNAKPKIASYPFTTIKPNVGYMKFADLRTISLADLPGLIEGAHKNVGMGHEFLRHCERTRLLLFVVDIFGFKLNYKFNHKSCVETVVLLNKEIELYRNFLLDKPAVLVVNKMDLPGAIEHFNEIKEQLHNMKETVQKFSPDIRPLRAIEFEDIIPMSAKTSPKDANMLQHKLRKYLDIFVEENNESAESNLLEELRRKQEERGPLLV